MDKEYKNKYLVTVGDAVVYITEDAILAEKLKDILDEFYRYTCTPRIQTVLGTKQEYCDRILTDYETAKLRIEEHYVQHWKEMRFLKGF